jgi:hypothetical protein
MECLPIEEGVGRHLEGGIFASLWEVIVVKNSMKDIAPYF